MSRLSPRFGELTIVDKPGLLKSKDSGVSNIVIYAALFEMSQELTLTLGPRYESI